MAKGRAVKLKQEDGVIYFKAIRPLTEESFKLLSDMLRHEAEQNGLKSILIPFSAALSNEKGE
jgi:hypothetical protein